MDPEQELLQPGAIRLVSRGFDISPADVNTDAHQVLAWSGPNDDLMVAIARRHQAVSENDRSLSQEPAVRFLVARHET
jgi:hypothetical protein